METTLDFLDEGIITVDPTGEIVRANLKAQNYLGLDHKKMQKVLSKTSAETDLLGKKGRYRVSGRYYVVEFGQNDKAKEIIFSVRPVFDLKQQ
jgi:sensor histidine kinase regulating citrate/malate metabolism